MKCINSFFFTFSLVSSMSSIPRRSSIFVGNRFCSTRRARADPIVSALVSPSMALPVESIAA